jgi:hypothetical protein
MRSGAHTVAMISIAGLLLHDTMRRSLLGANAQDPVVPDRPARRASRSEPSTPGAPDAPLRIGRDPREPAPVHHGAEERRAA